MYIKKLFFTLSILAIATFANAQVRSTDSTTNQPLNSASNILLGNTSKGIRLGAYAEIDYNQPLSSDTYEAGKLDVHRLVLFMGYSFSDRVQFVSEIEFEHVSEVYVEQAFINYKIREGLNLRAGLMLVPMGIINEYHEPTTYNGVERPNLEGQIVPTTWREMGVGFSGNFPEMSLRYQVYAFNGFNGYSDGAGNFRGKDAFRKGRQKGAESYMTSPNLSTKVDYYGIQGLKMGVSGYFGKSQSDMFKGLLKDDPEGNMNADSSRVDIAMLGFDARYQNQGFTARGMAVTSKNGNTAAYNGFTGNDLGSNLFGYYLEAGYDVLRLFKTRSRQQLNVFARYEEYDTHNKVAGDLARNLAYNRTDITIGAGYLIAPGAVLKADYQLFKNAAVGESNKKQLNFGIGIWF